MKDCNTKENVRSLPTRGSQPPPSTSCGQPEEVPSPLSTPLGVDLSWLPEIPENRCDFIWELDTAYRTPKGIRLSGGCRRCGRPATKWLHNLKAGKSLKCRCAPGGFYKDKRAHMLGARYHAMIQRCYTDTHVSSHNYKGRGIKVLFKRREFILWALATWPDETFLNKDFDRIDNDGHYSFENLRLISRERNLNNTRVSKDSMEAQAQAFMKMHPDFQLQPIHVRNLLQQKKTWEEIEELAASHVGLTKKAKIAKRSEKEAEARRFLEANPGLVVTEDQVIRLFRLDVTVPEIHRVNAWKAGFLPRASLRPETLVLLDYPELEYAADSVVFLLRKGMTGEDIFRRRVAKQQTPRMVAKRFVEAYPGTYGLSSAYQKLRGGMTWDQLVAAAGVKFRSKMSMT